VENRCERYIARWRTGTEGEEEGDDRGTQRKMKRRKDEGEGKKERNNMRKRKSCERGFVVSSGGAA